MLVLKGGISLIYNYYCIKTDCLSNTWETVEIEDYLRSISIFKEDLELILCV